MLTAYRFDNEGYFNGTCAVQEDGQGGVLLPADCVLEEPVFKENAFARFVDGKWITEDFPSSCADAIAQNFHCVANSPDLHQQQCKKIIEDLVAADPENYRTKVDANFIMSIEEITEEEKQTKADEAAKAELEADIAAVREDMMTAIAIGDDIWLDELRAEYQALLNGGEN